MPAPPAPAALPREPAQGSRFLTVADLFPDPPAPWLFQPPMATRLGDADDDAGRAVTDLLAELASSVRDGRRVVLVGGADIGKTTTAYALMQHLNGAAGTATQDAAPPDGTRTGRLRRRAAPTRRAVVVDLAGYVNDYRRWPDYFGTTLWLRSAGPYAGGPVRTSERPLMILDGVDALLRGAASRDDVLGRSLFTDAMAVTCSEAVFRQAQARGLLGQVEAYRLEGLSISARMGFGRRAVEVLAGRLEVGEQHARWLRAEVERAIRRDVNNGHTFREPLYLLLQVEAIVDGRSGNPRLDHYVAASLEQETASGARTLPPADMLDVLSDLAWLLQPHQDRAAARRGGPAAATTSSEVRIQPLGSVALDAFVQATSERLHLSADALRAELGQCKFLAWSAEGVTITGTAPTRVRGGTTPGLGVYQDYLVARGITRRLLSPEEGLAERFETLLPGGVVVLLVEELMRISRSEELRRRVVSRLRSELLDAATAMACADVRGVHGVGGLERLRRRTVCEQLSYYLAVTAGGGPEGAAVLRLVESRSVLRDDLWIRRGVTVGLGFGGRDGVIHDYVVELLDERDRHDASCPGECSVGQNRQVNVEFNLVLFGDADPLEGQPDRCALPDGCERTLGGMLDLLEVDLLERPGGSELSELVLFLVADLHDYHWDEDPTCTVATSWRTFFSSSAAPAEAATEADGGPWTSRRRLEEAMERLSSNGRAQPMIDRLVRLLSHA